MFGCLCCLAGAVFSGCSAAIGSACAAIATSCVAAAGAIKVATGAAIAMAGKLASTGLGKLVTGMLKKISTVCNKIFGPKIGPIATQLVVENIAETLGKMLMPQQKEEMDMMGYRLDEADKHPEWSKPEDFETFEEYYEYLKQQIPDEDIDKEEVKKNKLGYEAISIGVMTEYLAKEYAIGLDEDFLVEVGKGGMEPNEIRAIIEAYKALGYESVSLSDLLQGTMSPYEKDKLENAIKEKLEKYYPNNGAIKLDLRLRDFENCSLKTIDGVHPNGYFIEHTYADKIKDIAEHGEESEYLDKEFLNRNR